MPAGLIHSLPKFSITVSTFIIVIVTTPDQHSMQSEYFHRHSLTESKTTTCSRSEIEIGAATGSKIESLAAHEMM